MILNNTPEWENRLQRIVCYGLALHHQHRLCRNSTLSRKLQLNLDWYGEYGDGEHQVDAGKTVSDQEVKAIDIYTQSYKNGGSSTGSCIPNYP